MEKNTNDLLEKLKTAESLDGYLHEQQSHMIRATLVEQLEQLLQETTLSKAVVLQRAEINDIYGYQLFAGSRRPSRDKLMALCIGFSLDIERTQSLLKSNGFAPLYPKNERDSIILYGIEHGLPVFELNTLLYDHGYPTI